MSRSRVPGALMTLVGLALGLEATTFDTLFLTDPVGPKALPLLVAVILVWAGVATWRNPPESALPERAVLLRITGAGAAFLLYALALGPVGFGISTTLAVTALSSLYGAPLRKALPAAAAFTASLWVLFVYALSLPLPIGELWIR